MVRSYTRHAPTLSFGLISSPASTSSYTGRLGFVAGWEDVLVWDLRKGELVSLWHSEGQTSPVTQILPAPSPADEPTTFAVAHQNGSLKLWSFSPPTNPSSSISSSDKTNSGASELLTLNGHKTPISALCFSLPSPSSLLFSGSAEGEIIAWDLLAEVGLFRLKGHRGGITGIKHLPHPNPRGGHKGWLLSSSKDGTIKVWDLESKWCIATEVIGKGEVLSLDCLLQNFPSPSPPASSTSEDEPSTYSSYLILAASSSGLIHPLSLPLSFLLTPPAPPTSLLTHLPGKTINDSLPSTGASSSAIPRIEFSRAKGLEGWVVVVQVGEKAVVTLRIRSEEEWAGKVARRRRREKEKAKAKSDAGEVVEALKEEEGKEGWEGWLDRVVSWGVVRSTSKIRSFSLVGKDGEGADKGISILLSLTTNSLETHHLPLPPLPHLPSKGKAPKEGVEPTRTHVLEMQGHRGDVRCLAMGGGDEVVASGSNGSLKIWNLKTTQCIRTMECGYAICCVFLPGDRHILVGTKSGHLELFDIPSSTLLSSTLAHSGPVWSLDIQPGGRGVVSGSADKDVKFWECREKEVAVEGEGGKVVSRLGVETIVKTKQLHLVHVKTLKMTDDVLSVKYSPDGRLLAVSLLDSTVKVFFADTLKFFLSLYGHKLPVLAMDISSDSKLIITCSADKNVKIWGLDFGDCHKSIFAHEESIMSVAFEKGSHFFWTVGKDKLVKYWDGDRFELIQKLEGHQGEVWALAVGREAGVVVTGSHDKSIRVWEKTDEPLFLEEERERELEQMYETGIADSMNKADRAIGGDDDGEDGVDHGLDAEGVQKTTTETLMAGEKIMDAIELADEDRALTRDYEESKSKLTGEIAEALMPPKRSAMLQALGSPAPEDYVLSVLEKVPAASMEDALLVLPFKQVISLLEYLDLWARSETNIALASRILFFLLKTHHHQIVSNRIMRTSLVSLRQHLRNALDKQKETLGYNMAALKYIRRQYEADKTAGMMENEGMDEEKVRQRIEDGRKKRKRVVV